MRCSSLCRKPAKFFGKFAGGCCEKHAMELARDFGVRQFHPEYREHLEKKLAEQQFSMGEGREGKSAFLDEVRNTLNKIDKPE